MLTAHRRAWALRTGLMAVLVAGTLGGVALPAAAAPGDDPSVTITKLSPTTLQPGGQATLSFTITAADNATDPNYSTTVTSSLSPDIRCNGDCTFSDQIQPGGQAQHTVTLTASQRPNNVQPGQQESGNIKVQVTSGGILHGNGGAIANQQIVLQVPAQAPPTTQAPTTVNQVSGTVKDIATGSPISGAQVAMQDDNNHTFNDTTDSAGRFSFKSTDNRPISPGVLAFVVTKDGYQEKDLSQNVVAGQSYTLPAFVLTSTAPASASTASDAPLPTQAGPTGSLAPLNTGAAAAGGGSSGGFSTVLIVLGALLVLGGVAAIGIILWRRRNDNGEPGDEEDEDGMPRRGPTPVPASRGAYRGGGDATQIQRGGGYGDPTMVSREMAEAPTMMHQPVVDEYPDPYGAPDPATRPAGYGSDPYAGDGYGSDPYAGGGYGDSQRDYDRGYDGGGYDATQPAHGTPGQRPAADPYAAPNRDYGAYNEPTTYGRAEPPASGGGYGAAPSSGGGYGAAEPTRRGGYGDAQATSRYEPDGGYGDAQATSRYEGGGYGSGGGYESGGYESGGRDSGGYESGGGYQDSTRRYDGGGYGATGGYEQSGGRGGGTYGGGQSGYDEPRGGYGSDGGGGGYNDPRGRQEPRGGYEPRGGREAPADAYEQPRGGHAPRGGYGAPPQETRRSLDWLDD